MLRLPVEHARRQWNEHRFVYAERVLDPADRAAVEAEFPPVDDPRWHTFSGPLEHGKQEGSAAIGGLHVNELHNELADPAFVGWLRGVTGIDDLVADPERVGGGMHQCAPDGRLALHVDFNVHPMRPDLVRAVNVIVFVTRADDWKLEWGGYLKLRLPDEMTFGFAPLGGRMVVFAADDTMYHGHPEPLSADAPVRRSIPAYYYRPLRDGEVVEQHSTRFLGT